jgi:nucleoside-diphosphate-sugar epimerase
VYGPWAVGITEETPPAPLGPYGFSKVAAEAAVRRSDQAPWFDYQILRLAPVYGPGGPAYFDRLVRQILERGWIPPVEHGRWLEQWIHVSDATNAVLLSITNDTMMSNTFNLAGGETVTRPQLTVLVRALAGLGEPPSPDHWPAVPLYDTTKAQMLLGFTPAVSLVEGLTELVTAHG